MDSPARRNFSTSSKSTVQEGDVAKVVFDHEELNDLALVSGVTPFDELCSAEERATITGMSEDERSIRINAISGLVAWLFKPTSGGAITPYETCVRLWILVYCLNPAALGEGGMSLETMGRRYFNSSKQTLSKRKLKIEASLNLWSRNSKSSSAVESYRESATAVHQRKKDQARREARKAYNERYKRENKERIAAMNRSYYASNRARILTSQRKRRSK